MRINKVHLWAILVTVLLIRLLSLGAYPLMDTTEARYGEMARLMIETGNWLTPQFDYGVPFWGKPPLFTWMSAGGIELFGLNEFAVRVPHWFAGLLVIGLMAYLARRAGFSGLITSLVIATCGVFAISAGAVMTDMALTLGLTLAMVGFYLCWQGKRVWGYLGFIGLAIGLLAKGPLVIVLMGLAVMPWLILQHGVIGGFRTLWNRFPIVSGVGLMLLIALPWYLLAERATPGFLNYFIVGEHFKRFVVSGWEGDLYGSAHDEPRGMIWLFWLYSALPWSIVLPVLLWKNKTKLKALNQDSDGLVTYLMVWLVSPLVLFTLSGNILPAYVLPGIPALGLLVAMLVKDIDYDAKWFKVSAAIVPALLVLAVVYIHLFVADKRSDKVIFVEADKSIPTYYIGKRPFSGQFYSSGKAKQLTDESVLLQLDKVQLVGDRNSVESLVQQKQLTCVAQYTAKSHRALYLCERT
ncbi:glycosyltransferase family 39 protein [Vibrio sp. SCSIO 43135]|uniref:ArnT family glycosyltransferase n=1 Tax=Vibrio sp. SCSIO 43135 TaxID=2819096 RepID=UPI002076649F|nr:glycosyltransferase family 39 protein [Vibrio sp. SCSIO 43135]USD42172.1 glycosyltransferase family 39 protein [Vibrio sp. SCSIO 43135]